MDNSNTKEPAVAQLEDGCFNPLFPLGRVVTNPGAYESIPLFEMLAALDRHQQGDWGDLCEEDKTENQLSLREGFRILSRYASKEGVRFWIITEADRTVTTVLLPSEY